MNNICMNCEHWQREKDNNGYHKFGNCNNENFVYTGDGDEAPENGLSYSDHEGYFASFRTGEKFGCIHFKLKETKE